MHPHQKLGEILVHLKLMKFGDIDRILESMAKRRGRQKFGQMACDMGLIRDEHILAALAVQMNLLPNIRQLSLNQILDALLDPVG